LKPLLIIIDEIGKMELFSHLFSELVRDILAADTQLLATVAMKGGGLIREIKQRPEVHLFEVTRHNRDRLPVQILQKERIEN
jgi:nucleoside-triphosphatase